MRSRAVPVHAGFACCSSLEKRDHAWESIRVMPFYCGKRSASICVVLGPKKSSTYCSEYVSGFFEPCICQYLLFLATKDDSDRLPA